MFDFSDRVVVVTGATGNLGGAVARAFGDAGAKLTLVADETIKHFGRIDVLVNTAGGYRAGSPVHETPIETWDFMLNLNARSVFLTSRAVIPCMLRQGYGKIISVAARAAERGVVEPGSWDFLGDSRVGDLARLID